MQYYIEYVLLDNLIINHIIITLTLKTLKIHITYKKIFLVSFLGAVFAVVMPFIILPVYMLFFLKMLVGLVLVLCLKKQNIKNTIITYLLFLTYTFILGGVCFALLFMLNPKININSLVILGFDFPISIFVLIVFFYLYFLFKLIVVLNQKKSVTNYIYSIVLKNNNKTYNLKGFLDTGNQLNYNYYPVSLINLNTFYKVFNILPQNLLLNNIPKDTLNNANFIMANSISGQKKILVFTVDELTVVQDYRSLVYKNAYIGLALTNFNDNFDCLLNPQLF